MDGRAHERDDVDGTHSFHRFGQDPTPADDAYGDDVGPDTGTGAAPLPHRFGQTEPAPAVWGEPEPDTWKPAEPPRAQPAWGDSGLSDPPSGAIPQYGRLQFGGPPARSESNYDDEPSYAVDPTSQPTPFERPSYGGRPMSGFDAPAAAQPLFNQVPAQPSYGPPPTFPAGVPASAPTSAVPAPSDGLPYRRGGFGLDGSGTDSEGFPAVAFGGRGEPIEGRILGPAATTSVVLAADTTGEARARHGSRELVPVRARRIMRRGRVSDEDSGEGEEVRARRSMPLWQELPLLLVVAFCLAVLIRTFLLQAFFIPSGSMEQTLLVGDRVLVNKIVYDVRPPERGEVVVFRGTDNWAPENFEEPPSGLLGRIGRTMGDLVGVSRPGEKDFIKRVIGLPGDRVSCCDPSGRVYVNGKGIDEPYVLNNSPLDVPPDPRVCRSRRFDEVLVPPGQIFVMGDHRIVSQDARCQGPVPIENVIGRAFVIVWPSSRWDTLNVPDTFADVPGPVALGPPGSTGANVRVGAAVVTLPILASLVVTTRWGRKPRWGRRTLRK